MRYLLPVIAIALVLSAPAFAQSAQKPADKTSEHHAASGWKELDAFHELMAASWHPAKATKDMKIARAKADSLAAAAKTWAAAKAPHGCDSTEIKAAIADVEKGSADVAKLVAGNAADADLYKALHDVHERFEVVEKGCKPAHH
jgi:type IV secretory pathway TrbL component